MNGPKILCLDIETCPIEALVFGIWDQNVGLNQIQKDWTVLSWAAKWVGKDKVFYQDVSKQKDKRDDSKILQGIWDLLNDADIVLTQNGKSFDIKKLNARFVINGFKPPSSFRQIDTRILAKKHFGFTSNKLEYMTDKLCTKYKKLKHKKFPGMELWIECLKGNKAAWKEMRTYNEHDVLSTEELYTKIIAWDNTINFNVYVSQDKIACSCGKPKFKRNGTYDTNSIRYDRYKCTNCGAEVRVTNKEKPRWVGVRR